MTGEWPPCLLLLGTRSSNLKKVVVSCVLPTQGLVLSCGPTATLWTDMFHSCHPKAVEQLAGLRKMDIGYKQFKRLLTFLFGC